MYLSCNLIRIFLILGADYRCGVETTTKKINIQQTLLFFRLPKGLQKLQIASVDEVSYPYISRDNFICIKIVAKQVFINTKPLDLFVEMDEERY